MNDKAGALILRLLGARDPAFDPPPFSAAVAEEVLGPSGAMLTPHRRLLELVNGTYLHGHALHLFGACEGPAWHSLRAWNAPATWRHSYGGRDAGLLFFAEDAFGDQFAYNGVGGEIVVFEAETGRVTECMPHFVAWLEEMVERPGGLLPIEVLERERARQQLHQPGTQLFSWPPLAAIESREGVSVGHVDAVEAMRFRGQLAERLGALPPGTQVEIDFADMADLDAALSDDKPRP